jgi:hypothetical protein
MKFGVLGFGYESFDGFAQEINRKGYYTINLGDNAQSLATRHLYRLSGIPDDQLILVSRDMLRCYDGEEAVLVMNGVFFRWSFPISKRILPIFVGFNTDEQVVKENIDFFKAHEPIGCRDSATTAIMQSHGVTAFTTGCLTLVFSSRTIAPPETKLLIVYGSGQGSLPSQIFKHIPAQLADTAELIFHRLPVFSYPLSSQQCMQAEKYESDLMETYRTRATMVLTPLHHVCTPCLAMGIPVVVCRNDFDARFSYLQTFLPIYTPDRFSQIDWDPKPVNVEPIKFSLINTFKDQFNCAISRGV